MFAVVVTIARNFMPIYILYCFKHALLYSLWIIVARSNKMKFCKTDLYLDETNMIEKDMYLKEPQEKIISIIGTVFVTRMQHASGKQGKFES